MVWIQLAIAVAIFVVGELLRKPPSDALAANFDDFGFPDVDPSKRIPVIWGKKRIQSLHTMDVQGYRTRKIKVKSGLFGDKVTVGFRYIAGIMIGVCRGSTTGVTVTKIILDDKVIFEGNATPTDDGFVININDKNFHGSDDGISGIIRVYPGTPTQTVNQFFKDKHDGDSLPSTAYRNVCYLAFEDFYWGNNPTVGQIEVVATRYPDTLGIGANRIINTTANESPTQGTVDLAIPEIINEILTDDDWGLGESAVNDIDITSFTAVASTLRDEDNAMSLIWIDGDSIHDLMKIVMQQADGFVFKRMSTGLWEMNLARDDYLGSPLQLIEFDEDNSQMIRFTRGSWDETINIINLNWSDRDLKGKAVPAHEQDMSNIDIQLGRQVATYTFPGCHSATLAGTLAARQLRATSFPLIMAEITTTRLAWDLNPGDVIRFSWLQLGIADVFLRINKISLGTPENGEIRLSLVQDVFGIGRTSFGAPRPSLGVPQAGAPVDIVIALVEDQSNFIAQQDPDNLLQREKPLMLAKAPQGNALEFVPHVKLASESTFIQQDNSWAYAGSGVLATGLPQDSLLAGGSPESDFEDIIGALVITLVDATDAAGGPFTENEQKDLGAGMILIQSNDSPQGLEFEMLSFEEARIVGTTVTLLDVERAVEDTVPRVALAGDRVWFMAGASGTSVTTYDDTDDLDIRLENIASTGRTGIGSALTFGQQLRRRLDRPFPSAFSKYGSSNFTPVRYPTVVVNAGDILVNWRRRNKDNTSLYFQDDVDDPISPLLEYDVTFYSIVVGVLTLERTVTTTGTSVTYTKAEQTADGGPFPRYMVRIQSRDVSTESPGLLALDHVDRRFKYDRLISPLSSPVQPARLSPVPSPIPSPVPSPFSPFPFLSPISPATPLSPLPSPKGTFESFVRSLDPLLYYRFTETSGAIENEGSGSVNFDLTATGTPGLYAQDDRAELAGAFDFDGNGSFVTSDAFDISNSQKGTIFCGFKWEGPGQAETFQARLFNFFAGFDDWDFIVMVSQTGGRPGSPLAGSPGLPLESPVINEYIRLAGSSGGTQSQFDYSFLQPDGLRLGDNKWHTLVIRKQDGVDSPDYPEVWIDGVKLTIVLEAEGVSADATNWFGDFDSNVQLRINARGNPVQSEANWKLDEFAYFDDDALSVDDILCLDKLFKDEVYRSSPLPSPISPTASPRFSPVQSPISPVQSPQSPAPSPFSPEPSPFSPTSVESLSPQSQHGFRGFILSEGPTAYWPFNDLQVVVSPPGFPDFSPVPSQDFVEEITGIVTESHGPMSGQNRPLTKDNTDLSAGSSGEGGWIEAADDVAYEFTDAWTIEFWFVSSLIGGTGRIVMQRDFGGGNESIQLFIVGSTGLLNCDFRDVDAAGDSTVVSTERLDDGKVHHVVITQDVGGGDATHNLYIDGHFDGVSDTAIGVPFDNSDPFMFMGNDQSNEGIRGLMAHFAIYSRVLSPDNVLDHYMEGVRWTPFYAKAQKMALHNWWRMHDIDNAEGAAVKDWGSYAQDGLAFDMPTMGVAGPLGGSQGSRAFTFNDNLSPQKQSPVGGHIQLPNDFIKLGNSPNPESGMLAAWFKRREVASPNEQTPSIIVGANATGVFVLRITQSNEWVLILIRSSGNDVFFTLDSKWTQALEEWGHIAVIADGSTKVKFYINGSQVPDGDVSVSTNGAGNDTWWFADIVADAGSEPWAWNIGLSIFNVAVASPGDTNSIWHGEISELMFLHNVVPTALDIMELYTAGLVGFDSMTEALRQTDPHHLVELSDSTSGTKDEMDNIADGVWAGTREESQMPMAADDDTFSLYFLRAARTYLEWASDSWLSEFSDVTSPLGVLPKAMSVLFTYSREEPSGAVKADEMFLISNTIGASSALNLSILNARFGVDHDVFPPSNKSIRTKNHTILPGRNTIYTFIQNAKIRDSLNSPGDDSYRRIFLDGDESAYEPIDTPTTNDNDPNYIEGYGNNGVNIETRIGNFSGETGSNRSYGGLMGHGAIWDHNISDEVARRLARRMRGFQELPLMIMQHSPEIYWRMDDPANPVHVEDHSGNFLHSDTLDASIDFGQPTDDSNLWHEDVGVMNTVFGGAATLTSQVLNVDEAKTVGGWFRVPTAASNSPASEALVALYDSATTDRFQEFGIVDQSGDYRVRYGGSNGGIISPGDTSIGTTNLVAGTWYFIVWVVDALSTTVTTYLDGALEVAADTVADVTGVTYDRFGVNTREDGEGDGSYHDIFVINKELTQSEIIEIYSKAFAPSYDNFIIHRDVPIAYWKLDDGWQEGQELRFYNSILNAGGHVDYGDQIAGSPELATGERGIVPNSVGLATDFTGAAAVDTNWAEYPVGSDPMSITWWMIEQGSGAWNSDGVICSYGNGSGSNGTVFVIKISNTGSRLQCRLSSGSGSKDWAVPSDELTHHYCMQLGDPAASPLTVGDLELYIDGVLITPIGTSGGAVAAAIEKPSPEPTFKIGVHVDGVDDILQGTKITRMAFFDRTLTADEIRAQFEAGSI